MPRDPTIAIHDCLTEIAILGEIAGRTTLQAFRNDPITRRAAAYAIQTISESSAANPGRLARRFSYGALGANKAYRRPHSSRILSSRRCDSLGNRDNGRASSDDRAQRDASATCSGSKRTPYSRRTVSPSGTALLSNAINIQQRFLITSSVFLLPGVKTCATADA